MLSNEELDQIEENMTYAKANGFPPPRLTWMQLETLLAQAPLLEFATEACEIVHATANGNTYGLTVEEQLEALRLAARHCSEAIGKGAT
jgi:hypothetical protein